MDQFSEAIEYREGLFHRADRHLDRIRRTLLHFGVSRISVPTLREFTDILHDAAISDKVPEEGVYKCRIVYPGRERLLEKIDFMEYGKKKIGSISLVESDTIEYSFKSTERAPLDSLLNESGADEIIIVKRGLLTDGSAYNIILEDYQKRLFTPSEPLLRGTMREELLESGTITPEEITPRMLSGFSHIHFINALNYIGDLRFPTTLVKR